jgi:hypothetical protein
MPGNDPRYHLENRSQCWKAAEWAHRLTLNTDSVIRERVTHGTSPCRIALVTHFMSIKFVSMISEKVPAGILHVRSGFSQFPASLGTILGRAVVPYRDWYRIASRYGYRYATF